MSWLLSPIGSIASLDVVADVTLSAIGAGELLQWNGSAWINQTLAEIGVGTGDAVKADNETITGNWTFANTNFGIALSNAALTNGAEIGIWSNYLNITPTGGTNQLVYAFPTITYSAGGTVAMKDSTSVASCTQKMFVDRFSMILSSGDRFSLQSDVGFQMAGGGYIQVTGGGEMDVRDGGSLIVRDSGDTDYVTQSHDGVDYNFVGTNTNAMTSDVPWALGNGLVSAPSYAFDDQRTTGMYKVASQQIGFALSGAQGYTMTLTYLHTGSSYGPKFMRENASRTNPTLIPYGGDDASGIGANAPGSGEFSLIAASTEIGRVTASGLAITGVLSATGAVTGSNLNVSNWDTAYGWGDWSGHTHELDELDATAITDGYVLTADGAGNAAWEAAAGGGAAAFVTKYKTADESVTSSTTYQADDHLAGFAMDNASYYKVEACLYVTGHTSGDMKAYLNFTNAVQSFGLQAHVVHNNGGHYADACGTGTVTSVELPLITSSYQVITLTGFIKSNATTGGTFDLYWAQNASHATATTVKDGSWMTLTKIS